jgi:hypothetical protein
MLFRSDSRVRLYYNQYRYSVSFALPGAHRVRNYKDEDTIVASVRHYNFSIGTRSWQNPILASQLENLVTIGRLLKTSSDPYKHISSYDQIYIYTNDVALLETIAQSPAVTDAKYSQAVVDLPSDVVVLKRSKYQYRTYFKSKLISTESSTRVSNFLLDRTDCYRFTPGLKHMLQTRKQMYFREYYFVDHNGPGDMLMLAMVCPGVVRKTMPIQTK